MVMQKEKKAARNREYFQRSKEKRAAEAREQGEAPKLKRELDNLTRLEAAQRNRSDLAKHSYDLRIRTAKKLYQKEQSYFAKAKLALLQVS